MEPRAGPRAKRPNDLPTREAPLPDPTPEPAPPQSEERRRSEAQAERGVSRPGKSGARHNPVEAPNFQGPSLAAQKAYTTSKAPTRRSPRRGTPRWAESEAAERPPYPRSPNAKAPPPHPTHEPTPPQSGERRRSEAQAERGVSRPGKSGARPNPIEAPNFQGPSLAARKAYTTSKAPTRRSPRRGTPRWAESEAAERSPNSG